MSETASTRRQERGQATRAALIAASRALFAEKGFAGTSIDDIVGAAAVTRGALYHHFDDKAALFRAAFEQLEGELRDHIVTAASKKADPLDQFAAGVRAYLDRCLDPAVQRILLLDGPSVLGWETWQEIEAEYGLGVIQAGLQAAMDAGALERRPVQPLAHLLFGAVVQGSMLLARSPHPRKARTELERALDHMVRSFTYRQ